MKTKKKVQPKRVKSKISLLEEKIQMLETRIQCLELQYGFNKFNPPVYPQQPYLPMWPNGPTIEPNKYYCSA